MPSSQSSRNGRFRRMPESKDNNTELKLEMQNKLFVRILVNLLNICNEAVERASAENWNGSITFFVLL